MKPNTAAAGRPKVRAKMVTILVTEFILFSKKKKKEIIALVNSKTQICTTMKYQLHGYILRVLTHTTAWYQHWGGDETLKLGLVYVAWILLS